MIEEHIKGKIAHLITRAATIGTSDGEIRNEHHFAECEGWLAEAHNVVQLAVPFADNAYRQRIEKLTDSEGKSIIRCVISAAAVLRGLLEDIQAGLLGDFGNQIRAETFDDLLEHAEYYLSENRLAVAGVIAGVAFEDTIRRIYRNHFQDDPSKQKLEQLINALSSQRVITGLQSKQAKVAADLRNKAAHASWPEVTSSGVEDTIKVTRLFLEEHLGA